MSERRNPVVASLENRSPHPYSSVALSPSRQHAIVAGKDTLRVLSVGSEGVSEIRSVRVSQHFQTSVTSAEPPARSHGVRVVGDVRDAFNLVKPPQPPQNMINATVSVEDVAWSLPLRKPTEVHESLAGEEYPRDVGSEEEDSFVAAAGSNGVVVVWNARQAFLEGNVASMVHQPVAVLTQHTRAVNRLAWHPTGKYPGYLLTASQDGTVKLWDRTSSSSANSGNTHETATGLRSWFSKNYAFPLHPSSSPVSYSWYCKTTFEPKSEAIRDIRWSPFHDDVLAMVTETGYLIVYNLNWPKNIWLKITAHSGEASTLDWHPTRPYVIATGGANDRSVKIWDLESKLSLVQKEDSNISQNYNTAQSDLSQNDSVTTEGSSEDALARTSGRTVSPFESSGSGTPNNTLTRSWHSIGAGQSLSPGNLRPTKASTAVHVLSISASVTRLIWRPPAFLHSGDDKQPSSMDPHDGMMAVATASVKGGTAGGNGLLSLWSHHRPFMPLSVVEGHQEGSVTDFVWLDTPRVDLYGGNTDLHQRANKVRTTSHSESGVKARDAMTRSDIRGRTTAPGTVTPSSRYGHAAQGTRKNPQDIDDNRALADDDESQVQQDRSKSHIWQHVLSVGRDGRCLLQSFARGDRPISRVSPSCFAMANLSPFQRGYGSLQIFSVHQHVPSGPKNDYRLTGLRQDSTTARAPGVFREVPQDDNEDASLRKDAQLAIPARRHPATPPQLVFNVLDQGDLDENSNPVTSQSAITVAPEVVHLSRFADAYKFQPNRTHGTRVALCLHNGDVAERLHCGPLTRMWRMVAAMLEGSGLDELPKLGSTPMNAMQFTLLPTLRNLLDERANAGDVQTCVALCETLQVIEPRSAAETTRIPGLKLNLVREWYLSYIDLLQQMCLFSHASFLIRSCNDPFVGALNQQSTTIKECCPHCNKPIELEGVTDQSPDGGGVNALTVRRACSSCRRRVGMCFLCHEQVKGVYVWCPGCGHGGHLEHALEWFGGTGGKSVREQCPTGCGHRCNLSQQLSAFPRTDSLLSLPSSDS